MNLLEVTSAYHSCLCVVMQPVINRQCVVGGPIASEHKLRHDKCQAGLHHQDPSSTADIERLETRPEMSLIRCDNSLSDQHLTHDLVVTMSLIVCIIIVCCWLMMS